jgi:hypothetical protein
LPSGEMVNIARSRTACKREFVVIIVRLPPTSAPSKFAYI